MRVAEDLDSLKATFFDDVVGGCDFETALDLYIQEAVKICEEELALNLQKSKQENEESNEDWKTEPEAQSEESQEDFESLHRQFG